jgi:hypothetical protein
LQFAKSAEYSIEDDIRRFGDEVYLKDGTPCDVVVFVNETHYKTKNGLFIYHHGLFSLDTFPDYYPDKCAWRYNVPLYYRGVVRYMSRNVNEQLVYETSHKFTTSERVQAAFDQVISTCFRTPNKTLSFSKMIEKTGVLVSSGVFSTRSALDDYLRVVCGKYNPCYLFGFDKCAPYDNIGFKMPMFMIHYIEFKKWSSTNHENMLDERQYAAYLLAVSSITGCVINYSPRHDE